MWNIKRIMKGQLSAMPDAVIALVLIAIVAAVGLLVLSNFQTNSSVTANSAAYNAIGQGISGVSTVTSFLSLIALVVVAAIIIGLVVYAFARGGGAHERF